MNGNDFEERYARQLVLPDFGKEKQQRLGKASALLVGVGGLGSGIAPLLCAAGIGRLVMVDADHVSVSNLQRQILYRTPQKGLSKIQCATESLRQLNPNTEIVGIGDFFSEKNALHLAQGCDIIVDGCDNAPARYLMNDLAVGLKLPFVYGSVCEFSGQVSVFNLTSSDCTYRCLFPQAPQNTGVKGVMGPLPSLIASIEANECIKVLTGYGQPLSNRLFCCNLTDTTTACFALQPTQTGRQASLESFKRLSLK